MRHCQRILYLRAAAAAAAPTRPQPARDLDALGQALTGSTPLNRSSRTRSSRTSTAAPAAIPGPAGYGVRIEQPDGTLVEEFAESIGVATNNVAEYRALLAALEWAQRARAPQLHVRSDSLLLVQQMLGNYKVKHPGLQPLHAKARLLAHEIGRVTFEHVGRAQNAHADRLANAAMDGAPLKSAGADRRPVGLRARRIGACRSPGALPIAPIRARRGLGRAHGRAEVGSSESDRP